MATTGTRKSISIHDYPEHLNPFREDDNHNKIRFWTLGKKLNRSNSINFSVKDLKNSWAFRSFMRKGKKGQDSSTTKSANSTTIKSNNHQVNGDSSPIVFRRAVQYSSPTAVSRSTLGSPERLDRYVYGGSVTPLPRSRFQERLRSSSQQEVSGLSTPRMARSEVSGSRLSVESANPFDDAPIPPVRASRRKKKRAPLPPSNDVSTISESSLPVVPDVEVKSTNDEENKLTNTDRDLEEMDLNIELKIVEDDDLNKTIPNDIPSPCNTSTPVKENECVTRTEIEVHTHIPNSVVEETTEVKKTTVTDNNPTSRPEIKPTTIPEHKPEEKVERADSADDILKCVSFPKVDIIKYRRNSSVNEDDIRLRRGNLEDFHVLTTKRSKSLTNTNDTTFVTYDFNLNEKSTTIDTNGNEEHEEPQKVICKLYNNNSSSRKGSTDNSISSTEREFLEIDKVRREIERDIQKLNAALTDEDLLLPSSRVSVSDMRRKFDNYDVSSPNPIPKPKRKNSPLPVNGKLQPYLN